MQSSWVLLTAYYGSIHYYMRTGLDLNADIHVRVHVHTIIMKSFANCRAANPKQFKNLILSQTLILLRKIPVYKID